MFRFASSESLRRNLPIVAAAVRNIIILVAVLSIPLRAAEAMALSTAETTSWILVGFGLPGLLSIVMTLRYRLPLLLTGNLFVIIFVSGLGGEIAFPALMGASLLAGVGVLLIGILGLTRRLASLVPVPIMFGLLAGAVMPFLAAMFSVFGQAPVVVGGTLLVYLVSQGVLGKRVPAILPALVAGVLLAAVTGRFEPVSEPLALTLPRLALPVFSLPAILTVTPLFIVLMTLQANLPAVRFLQSQDYDPPEIALDLVSGIGTILGSFLGPVGVSLSLPATSVVANPEAGAHEIRHRAVYLVAGVGLLVGLLAGLAVGLTEIIPEALLATLAGLALLGVLGNAVQEVARGPLLLGPLFAFAIALSDISFLGFGNYFWSLVMGTGVSLLLERDELRALRRQREEERREK